MSIAILRALERQHVGPIDRGTWETFTEVGTHFGLLLRLNEHQLPPGGETEQPTPHSGEALVSWVREGAVTFRDHDGMTGVVLTSEVQLAVGRSTREALRNASEVTSAQVFQLRFRTAQRASGRTCRRFTVAQRRGALQLIAAPDRGVLVFSGVLAPGRHIVHPLAPGRAAWLHVVDGSCLLGALLLERGDGAGLTSELSVSFTAQCDTEVLLIELPAEGTADAVPRTEEKS